MAPTPLPGRLTRRSSPAGAPGCGPALRSEVVLPDSRSRAAGAAGEAPVDVCWKPPRQSGQDRIPASGADPASVQGCACSISCFSAVRQRSLQAAHRRVPADTHPPMARRRTSRGGRSQCVVHTARAAVNHRRAKRVLDIWIVRGSNQRVACERFAVTFGVPAAQDALGRGATSSGIPVPDRPMRSRRGLREATRADLHLAPGGVDAKRLPDPTTRKPLWTSRSPIRSGVVGAGDFLLVADRLAL